MIPSKLPLHRSHSSYDSDGSDSDDVIPEEPFVNPPFVPAWKKKDIETPTTATHSPNSLLRRKISFRTTPPKVLTKVEQDLVNQSLFPESMTPRTPLVQPYAHMYAQLMQSRLPTELVNHIIENYSLAEDKSDLMTSAGLPNEGIFLQKEGQGPRLFAIVLAYQCSSLFSSRTLAYACDLSGLEIEERLLEHLKQLRATAVKNKVGALMGKNSFHVNLEEFFYAYPSFIIPVLYICHACKLNPKNPLDWKTDRSVASIKKGFQKLPQYALFRFQLLNSLRFNFLSVLHHMIKGTEKEEPPPSSFMQQADRVVLSAYGCTKKTVFPFSCQMDVTTTSIQLIMACPTRFFFQKRLILVENFDRDGFSAWLLRPNPKHPQHTEFGEICNTLKAMIGALYQNPYSSLEQETKELYRRQLLSIYEEVFEQRASPEWMDPLLETRPTYEVFLSFAQLYKKIKTHAGEGYIYNKNMLVSLRMYAKGLSEISDLLIPLVRVLELSAIKYLAPNHLIFLHHLQKTLDFIHSQVPSEWPRLELEPYSAVLKDKDSERLPLELESSAGTLEDKKINDSCLEDLLLFLERCHAALPVNAHWTLHPSFLAGEERIGVADNQLLMEAYRKVSLRLVSFSKVDLSLLSLINQLLDYSFLRWTFIPSNPVLRQYTPLERGERAPALNACLRSIGLQLPEDPNFQSLLENDSFFYPFFMSVQNGIALRGKSIKLLGKGKVGSALLPQWKICMGSVMSCAASYVETWGGIILFADLITGSLFPTSFQLFTDMYLLFTQSPSLIKRTAPFSLGGRFANAPGYRPLVTQTTPYWERALIFDSLFPRFPGSNVVYNGFEIKCETPYGADGKRLFREGECIISYAFPLFERAAKITIPLNLGSLEMNLAETELFLAELVKFIDLSPTDARTYLENHFSTHPFISSHPKKEQAAVIFSSFYESLQRGLEKVFFTAPRNRMRFLDVELVGRDYTALAKTYKECDKLLIANGFQEALDLLIPSYELEGFCDSLLFFLKKQEGIQDKSAFFAQLHDFANTTAERLFPKNKSKCVLFVEQFVTSGKQAQGWLQSDNP